MLHALELTKAESGDSREDVFTGPSQWMPHGRVFGGQVLAQCIVAAQRTMDDRPIHSLHGYFLRAGDINLPITFSVDRLRDGRSFSTRRVQAFQNDLAIFSMIASFQTASGGIDHQDEMPINAPDPESLPSTADIMGSIQHPAAQFFAFARPFDIRHIDGSIYLQIEGQQVAHQAVWVKALGEMPDDDGLHQAALAYLSDYTILEPAMRKHGISWAHPGLSEASLDHAMWFHRKARVDQWLLYVQESPSAQSGRGLALGRIFTADGVLVATVAQEGMLRIPEIR
jgi:acyl-CoA thioesterase-2